MENINFELYKVFYHVAKHGNLTKAAEELFISQPAVTQTIRKLEEQIGYTLFYRTKKGMNLTKEGEILFRYLKEPIECLQNGKAKIDELWQPTPIKIRIGGGTTVLQHNLLKPLQEFLKEHTSIQFIIKHDMAKHLLEMLSSDELDLVILSGTLPKMENILFIPIEEIRDRFVANRKAFEKYQDKIFSFKELNQLPLILQASSSSTRSYMDQIASSEHATLNATYELVSYGLVLEFIKAGLGIGFININHIQKELKNKQLFVLKTKFNIPSRHVYVAVHKKNKTNPMLQEFINYLKNEP